MRRHAAAILVLCASLIAACGSDPVYTAAPTPPTGNSVTAVPTAAKTRTFEIVAAERFAAAAWSAGSQRGRATLVRRSWPTGRPNGPYRFRFTLPKTRTPTVRLTIHTYVPLTRTVVRRIRLTPRTRTLDLRGGPSCDFLSCGRAPTTDDPTARYVAGDGSDAKGTGTKSAPFATIAKALASPGVATVIVRGGRYRDWVDDTDRAAPVTIRAAPGTRPVVVDAVLRGGGLHLEGLHFRGNLSLGAKDDPARDITVRNGTFTGPGYRGCASIESGAQRIRITTSWFRSCRNAIAGGYSGMRDGPITRDVRIEGNVIDDMYGDGVQMTQWEDVLIKHNVIAELHGRQYEDHNDGVQIVGGGKRVQIIGNEFRDSDNQMVLISEDFKLETEDVLVANNVMVGSGSWAINNFGATGVRIVNNTVWGSKAGAIIIGVYHAGKPETLVANNILDRIFLQGPAPKPTQTANIVERSASRGAKDLADATPRFRDAKRGDLRLSPRSPGRADADPALAPHVDQTGSVRGPRTDVGAYR